MDSPSLEKDTDWETLEQNFLENISSRLHRLRNLWRTIGIQGRSLDDRWSQAVEHYNDLSERMYEEDSNLHDRLAETVKAYIQTLEECCDQLDLPMPQVENGPPLIMKKQLEGMVEELEVLRQSRLDRLEDLRNQENELCVCLSMEPCMMEEEKAVPTEKDLEELQQHVDMLLVEKDERTRKYNILRSDILRVMNILELEATTVLQQEMQSDVSVVGTTGLSRDKLAAMKDLFAELKQQQERRTVLLNELSNKLTFLWDFLKQEAAYRQFFMKENGHIGQSGIKALQEEIKRCEELRRANMGHFINNLRSELLELWNKCQVSEEHRQQFKTYFNSDEYSENLLKKHEEEVLRWRTTFEKFEPLFIKTDRIGRLFQKALELQHRMTDPKRFHNRGGQLLQEEREKKKLLLQIPKMERELLDLSEQYQKTMGMAFRVQGLKVEDYLQAQWEFFQQEKENDKMQRKQRKEEELSTMTPKKFQRNGTMITPLKTPGCSIRKTPVCGTTMHGMTLRTPAFKSPGMTPLRSRGPLSELGKIVVSSASNSRQSPYKRKYENIQTPTMSVRGQGAASASAASISYHSFERNLNDPVRSTHKRSTLNSTRRVISSKVTKVFTNTGTRQKRFSNGRSPRLVQSNISSAGRSMAPKSKVLKVVPPEMPFLF